MGWGARHFSLESNRGLFRTRVSSGLCGLDAVKPGQQSLYTHQNDTRARNFGVGLVFPPFVFSLSFFFILSWSAFLSILLKASNAHSLLQRLGHILQV